MAVPVAGCAARPAGAGACEPGWRLRELRGEAVVNTEMLLPIQLPEGWHVTDSNVCPACEKPFPGGMVFIAEPGIGFADGFLVTGWLGYRKPPKNMGRHLSDRNLRETLDKLGICQDQLVGVERCLPGQWHIYTTWHRAKR